MNESMKWLDKIRGNDSVREAARKIGTTHATLSRQAAADALSFEVVRDLSRAYGRSVLADLLATGHLSPADAGVSDIENALHGATEEQLVYEIAGRLGVVDPNSLFDQPISQAFDNVHHLDSRRNVGVSTEDAEDADARRVAREREEDRGEDEGGFHA